jgi:hypothetical protein
MGHDSGQRSPDDTTVTTELGILGDRHRFQGLSAEYTCETLRLIILFPYNLKLNDFCGCNCVGK